MFRSLLLVFLLCSFSVSAQLEIQKIADSTYLFTTYRMLDKDLFPANGMIIQTSDGLVMIDTPWDTTQFQPLLDSLQLRLHQSVKLIIATHSHSDRTAGLTYYNSLGIATYTSLGTYIISMDRGVPLAQHYFIKDTCFTLGATKIETYYPGAGHTPDNQLIYLPQRSVLYGGCFIKSQEATNIGNKEDANLGMWPIALRNTKKKFRHAQIVVPGHQKIGNKKAIKHTLKLLR